MQRFTVRPGTHSGLSMVEPYLKRHDLGNERINKCHQIPSNSEDDGVRLAGHPVFESKVFLRNTHAGLLREALLAGRIAPQTAVIACVVDPDRSSA